MDKLQLRSAALSDAPMMLNWRNDLETRLNSLNSNPIQQTEHFHWVEQSLKMTNRNLLIAELNSTPIGVLRYDLKDKVGETHIYLSPEFKGKGHGARILQIGINWIIENRPYITKLEATILPKNVASIKAFEKAGFLLVNDKYEFSLLSLKN